MLRRRAARTAALFTVSAAALVAAPAHAGVPEGWSDPEPVDGLHYAFLLVGAPVGLLIIIALAVLAPALVRGEKLASNPEAQWIGGPRQGTDELPAPDGADSAAGGASGTF